MNYVKYNTLDCDYKPMFININGEPLKRTPFTHPYSYDEYVVWVGKEYSKDNHIVYSDRLHQWDSKKFNENCQEVFGNEGQYFDSRKPKDIERFLSLYFGKEIRLTAITQGCNHSSGFPYWAFFYKDN